MVAVVITTYNPERDAPRFTYLDRVLGELIGGMPADFRYIIADDGSPQGPPELVVPPTTSVMFISGPHNGIGASLNRALTYVGPDEPWIYTTDDWSFKSAMYEGYETLNIELALWLLTQGYDYVRLGPMHPNVVCTTRFEQGHGWWLEIAGASNQFAYATRPFVASSALMRKIGPWAEGVDSYVAEIDFANRCINAGIRAAGVHLHGPWEHIGEYEVGNRPVH